MRTSLAINSDMKKSPSKAEQNITGNGALQWLERDKVLRAFQELGYSEDFKNRYVTIIREIDFPFRRITLPNNQKISSALINLFLRNLGIDGKRFYQRIIQKN